MTRQQYHSHDLCSPIPIRYNETSTPCSLQQLAHRPRSERLVLGLIRIPRSLALRISSLLPDSTRPSIAWSRYS